MQKMILRMVLDRNENLCSGCHIVYMQTVAICSGKYCDIIDIIALL